MVAAVSEEIAEEALELIEVEYEELPALLSVDEALSSQIRIHDLRDDNLVVDPVTVRRGGQKGFKDADFIVEGTYAMGRPTPAYMEPNVCVAQWSEDRLTMWISTQTPFMVRGILAEVLGLPHQGACWSTTWAAASARSRTSSRRNFCARCSRRNRPSRAHGVHAQGNLPRRTLAPSRDGLAEAGLQEGRHDRRTPSASRSIPAPTARTRPCDGGGHDGATSLYRCDNVLLEGQAVYTNTPIAGAYRGYGVVQIYYALDIQMDEAAEKLGMDPAQLKLRNAARGRPFALGAPDRGGTGLEDCIRRGIEETAGTKFGVRARIRIHLCTSRKDGEWAARCTARAPIPASRSRATPPCA